MSDKFTIGPDNQFFMILMVAEDFNLTKMKTHECQILWIFRQV